jgi:hypothetical protein
VEFHENVGLKGTKEEGNFHGSSDAKETEVAFIFMQILLLSKAVRQK